MTFRDVIDQMPPPPVFPGQAALDAILERALHAHMEAREAWMMHCINKVMEAEGWTCKPDSIGQFNILYSQVARNAMGLLYKGEVVGGLVWNYFGGEYVYLDYLPFPYNP